MKSEKIFELVKTLGGALTALAAFVLACFGVKKEFDKAKEVEVKEEPIENKTE